VSSQEPREAGSGFAAPPPAQQRFGTAQVLFLASMVALDFGFGWVAKPLVHAVGLGTFLKLEMIPSVMLMLLTRLTLDRFFVLTAYQGAWGLIALVAMPGVVLPGPLKLAPLLLQGLFLDTGFSLFRRWGAVRVVLAAVLGGAAGSVCLILFRVLLGMPWARATQIFFGMQLLGSLIIQLLGALLALMVWKRIQGQEILGWLRVGR